METLEDLSDGDFNTFKCHLSQKISKSCKCQLASPHRYDTVSKMMDSYGEEMAVDTTVAILGIMKHGSAAEKLRKKYAEGAAARASSSCFCPTGRKVAARGAAGVKAPGVPNASNRNVTINGNVDGNVVL